MTRSQVPPLTLLRSGWTGNNCHAKSRAFFLSNFKGQQHFNTILNTHTLAHCLFFMMHVQAAFDSLTSQAWLKRGTGAAASRTHLI